jgi:hypothetical protein
MLQRARNAALMQLAAGELKYFANANLAGNPGNMSVFNTAWNEMGDKEVRGASRMPSSTHTHSLMTDLTSITFTIRGRPPSKAGSGSPLGATSKHRNRACSSSRFRGPCCRWDSMMNGLQCESRVSR